MRLIILFLCLSNFTFSQDLKGKVLELIDNSEVPIVGANIFWIDNSGFTVSDIYVNFTLSNPNNL